MVSSNLESCLVVGSEQRQILFQPQQSRSGMRPLHLKCLCSSVLVRMCRVLDLCDLVALNKSQILSNLLTILQSKYYKLCELSELKR